MARRRASSAVSSSRFARFGALPSCALHHRSAPRMIGNIFDRRSITENRAIDRRRA
jgi:hypothetical protein